MRIGHTKEMRFAYHNAIAVEQSHPFREQVTVEQRIKFDGHRLDIQVASGILNHAAKKDQSLRC